MSSGVPRYRPFIDGPIPEHPFIADLHSFDIPATIAACIRNASPNLVGIVLVDLGGPAMRQAAEQAAMDRNIHIIWENRVSYAPY